jgi:hypothetical protein
LEKNHSIGIRSICKFIPFAIAGPPSNGKTLRKTPRKTMCRKNFADRLHMFEKGLAVTSERRAPQGSGNSRALHRPSLRGSGRKNVLPGK